MESKQIKTKKRVADHGEVFTSEREVNAMLDLVKQETERIESRFLEPACGTGNFLAEIIKRKLDIVTNTYKYNPDDWEFYSVIAISSIYGIELLDDNCKECRERLFAIWLKAYQSICKDTFNNDYKSSIKYVLDRNILCGDALTMKNINNEPIIFSEWTAINSCLIKRRDYRLDELLEGKANALQLDITTESKSEWQYDAETKSYIPCPIKEYEPVHFRKIYHNIEDMV